MREVSGEIDKIKDSDTERAEKLNSSIKQSVNRLEKPIKVYMHFSPEDLGYHGIEDMAKDMNENINILNRDRIKSILNEYKYGSLTQFKTADLTKSGGEENQRFMTKVELPKGMYVGHLGDGRVVLPMDHGIKIKNNIFNKPHIVVVGGKEIIKSESEIIDKETIRNRKERMQESLNSKFKLENGSIELDIDAGFESYSIMHAKKAIDALTENLPSNILTGLKQNLKGIIFTDANIPVAGFEGDLGNYKDEDRKIYIRLNHREYLANIEKTTDQSRGLIHEVGHACQIRLFKIIGDVEFMNIYIKEKEKISDEITYNNRARENIKEFFAEVFKAMYSTDSRQRELIKSQAPRAVKFIRKEIEDYNPDSDN